VSPRFGHRPVTGLGLLVTDLGPLSGGRATLSEAGALTAAAEEAGFDSIWVEDNLGGRVAPGGAAEMSFEAYSLLGALATRTRSVRLGALPRGVDPRLPSSLAKIVTGIDVISGGRGVVTLTPGPGEGPEAVDRLAEALEVCRAVLDDQHPGFAGSHFTIAGAINQPSPVQAGGVPLVVILHAAEQSWTSALPVAGRFADAVVVDGDQQSVAMAAGSGHLGQSEVVWTGAVPRSTAEAVAVVAAVVAAGATGCIVALPVAGGLARVGELGPALREVLEAAPGRG
jgi:alkanesulfonate monooxygenase SsuD/methylene tetrahydromethanopterin reductase-like flavin-dependent oxidoreductase (luciferase family)